MKRSPWRWLELEAGRVVTEVLERAVMVALQRKDSRLQESRTRLLAEQQAKTRKKRRKPWSWLRMKASKVVFRVSSRSRETGQGEDW